MPSFHSPLQLKSVVYTHHIVFTCSSAAEHLDWFCFLAFMNSEIINREVKVSPSYVALKDSDFIYLAVASTTGKCGSSGSNLFQKPSY